MRIRQEEEAPPSFQIAPMVDVVFILMLFFMASAAQQVHETQLSMNLPSLGGSEPPPMTLEIQISANGLIACGAQGVSLDPVDTPTSTALPELIGKIQYAVQHNGDKTPIIINPDSDAVHQRVVDVLNACVKAGGKNVSFAG